MKFERPERSGAVYRSRRSGTLLERSGALRSGLERYTAPDRSGGQKVLKFEGLERGQI